jgi:hypothetical protein
VKEMGRTLVLAAIVVWVAALFSACSVVDSDPKKNVAVVQLEVWKKTVEPLAATAPVSAKTKYDVAQKAVTDAITSMDSQIDLVAANYFGTVDFSTFPEGTDPTVKVNDFQKASGQVTIENWVGILKELLLVFGELNRQWRQASAESFKKQINDTAWRNWDMVHPSSTP